MQHQHELAAPALRVRRQPGGRVRRRQGDHLLELLGQLAGDGQRARRDGSRQRGQQRRNAVRRLEQHQRLVGPRRQRLDRGLTFGRPRGQEADEGEALGVNVTGHRQGGDHAARARHRHAPMAGRAHRGHQRRARVGHRGGAGIAEVGHPLAQGQPLDNRHRGAAFVVLVHGDQRFGHPQPRQQPAAHARVLARHRVDQPEHMHRAQCQVGEVADRRGHQVQRTRRVLLPAGGHFGSLRDDGGRDR